MPTYFNAVQRRRLPIIAMLLDRGLSDTNSGKVNHLHCNNKTHKGLLSAQNSSHYRILLPLPKNCPRTAHLAIGYFFIWKSFRATNGKESVIIEEYAVQTLDIRQIIICPHTPKIFTLDK